MDVSRARWNASRIGLGLTLLPLLTGGCVATADVRAARGDVVEPSESKKRMSSLPGVPFYVRAPYCVEKQVFELRWVDVSLREYVEVDASRSVLVRSTGTISVDPSALALRELRNLTLREPGTELESVVWKQYQRLAADPCARVDPEARPDFAAVEPVSATRQVVARADYSRTHYFNARMPWFGSSTATSKISQDGTLTESTATSDSKLAELVPALLPLKEILAAHWTPSATEQKAAVAEKMEAFAAREGLSARDLSALRQRVAAEEAATRRFEISVVPRGYRWTRTREWRHDPQQVGCPATNAGVLESIERVPIRSTGEGSSPPSQRVIRLEGRAILPETEPR